MTCVLKNVFVPSDPICSSGGALVKRDVYIVNGSIDLTGDCADETWDLDGWLILPGLRHTLYLSPEEGMGLEMISNAVRKGCTDLAVDDAGRWIKSLSQSDFPDLASVLQKPSSVENHIQFMINPWQLIKKHVLELIRQGSELQSAIGKALESFGCSCIQQGQDADLIFIQLNAPLNQEKLTDLLFPILMLENEDVFIKAVMKKGQLIYSKYGASLDSKNFVFDESFYPQISQNVDSKFDSIHKAIRDIGNL
jgi:hypothetical protein